MILRHRRRGTFVNPHWLRPRAGPGRRSGSSSRRARGDSMLRDAAAGQRADQPRDGAAPVAAAGADALGRRGAGARPRGHRLRLDPRVRGGGLPAPDRGHRPRVGAPASTSATSCRRSSPRTATAGQTYGVSAFADVAGLWCRRRELDRARPRAAADLERAAHASRASSPRAARSGRSRCRAARRAARRPRTA